MGIVEIKLKTARFRAKTQKLTVTDTAERFSARKAVDALQRIGLPLRIVASQDIDTGRKRQGRFLNVAEIFDF